MKNIAIQCLLRPALTVVDRCLDYDNFRATIDRIDRLLIDSEVESQAIELALEGWQPMGQPMGLKARRQRASFAIKALRMDTLGRLLGGISFRHLSRALGSSAGSGQQRSVGRLLPCPADQWHQGHLQKHPGAGLEVFQRRAVEGLAPDLD